MKIKNYFLIFFFIVLAVNKSFCDSTSYNYFLKFSPLSLINNFRYDSGTIQFSFERNVIKNYSINLDLGYILDMNLEPGIGIISLDDLSGFVLETELRRYNPNIKEKNSGRYYSFQSFYKYIDALDHHTVLDSISTISPWIVYSSTEKYSINRNEFGFHLKIGYQKVAKSGFIYDHSIGLGWRRIISKNNSQHSLGSTSYEIPYHKPFEYGSKSFFSISISVRVGWAI